ncbi:Unknown protein, partial [Striga hermonthica]
LEDMMGRPPQTPVYAAVFERLQTTDDALADLSKKVDAMVNSVESLPEFVEGRMDSTRDEFMLLSEAVESKVKKIMDDVSLLKRVGASVLEEQRQFPSKVRIPDPKTFDGTRDAKDVENFLWDMEAYFHVARVLDDEKVSIASMFLSGDAKLWWRARASDDVSANREGIKTWDVMKRELRDQFLPCNTDWVAREALRNLKQEGAVREYVKVFSSLMLDISEMSERDKLFNFMAGLQGWAQAELQRQRVSDLPTAMAAAERLVDFKVIGASDSSEHVKDSTKKDGKSKKFKGGKHREKSDEGSSGTPRDTSKQMMVDRSRGCFLCDGDHLMKDCPKRFKAKANALVVKGDACDDEGTIGLNSLVLLNNVSVQDESCSGLMFVKAAVKDKQIMAMVDSGASHSFMNETMASRLGLKLEPSDGLRMKSATRTTPIKGVAEVDMVIGPWKGTCKVH